MRTKVSVIIPAYNCENYIERCINSLISADADLEIIAINDGSKDKTLEKLLSYGDKIKVIDKENGGVSRAREVGIKESTGDFILFCDADDYYAEGAVERLIKEQQRCDADIVRGGYKIFDDEGREKLTWKRIQKNEYIVKREFKDKIYPKFIRGIELNSVWSTLYRRDIIKNLTFRADMKTAEDAVFNMGAYSRAKSVALIKDVCYMYYQNSLGLTGIGLKLREKYRCNFILMRETLKLLDKWGMNTLLWKTKTVLRPLLLTADKFLRMICK